MAKFKRVKYFYRYRAVVENNLIGRRTEIRLIRSGWNIVGTEAIALNFVVSVKNQKAQNVLINGHNYSRKTRWFILREENVFPHKK